MFQKGANVVYHPVAPVHVSGHAGQEEQKMLLSILHPKFFVPIHGELRHLKQHAVLAQEVGIPKQNIAVVENGYVLRFTQDTMEIGERLPGGYIFVDGVWVGDAVSAQVIRDRESLAATGVFNVVFSYSQRRGAVVGEPRIAARGVASDEVLEEMIEATKSVARQTVQTIRANTPPTEVENAVKRAISDFFYKKAKHRPEIIVVSIPTD